MRLPGKDNTEPPRAGAKVWPAGQLLLQRSFVSGRAFVPLNQAAKPKSEQSSIERKWRATLATVPIERTGMKSELDESNLNRFVWHEIRGWETPYPERWSGAHAKGFKSLGLEHDPGAEED